MNLVEMLKNQLGGGDVPNLLSGALGTTPENARSAVNAGIPTVLAGLMNLCSTSEGQQRLSNVVDSADDNLPTNFRGMLANQAGSKNLMDGGANMLSSLLGGNVLSQLSGVLGRFTGLGSGSSGSLLAMLAPMVLGFLKGQKRQLGLSPEGLGNLLADQKSNIASALPSGLGGMLAGIPGMESMGWLKNAAGSAVASTAQAGRAAASHAYGAAQTAATAGTSAMRWLMPLAAVLLLVLGIWYFVGRGTPRAATAAGTAATAVADRVAAQFARLSTDSSDVIASATTALTEIKDPASASAAMPKLQDLGNRLDSLTKNLDTLPAESRTKIASLFKTAMEKLQPLIDKAAAIPGIGDDVRQALNGLMERVRSLSVV